MVCFFTFKINIETGKYEGLVGGLIPTTEFFAHYGNIYNIKSNFLVVFDKKGNYIATPRAPLLGKNYFGNEAQQIFHHNPIQGNLYRQLLEGIPGNAVYDFGIGERLNTGYPIFVQGKPTYFVSAVTPTSVIYSQINFYRKNRDVFASCRHYSCNCSSHYISY